jgi:hypothetical protein
LWKPGRGPRGRASTDTDTDMGVARFGECAEMRDDGKRGLSRGERPLNGPGDLITGGVSARLHPGSELGPP